MSIEQTLLRYKQELESTQSNLDKEKGVLSSVYDSLKEELELKGKPTGKEIENKSKEELIKLIKESDELNDELEQFIEEIEEELESQIEGE